MGGEDVAEGPAFRLEFTLDGGPVWRVDGSGVPADRVMEKNAIIVGPADELVDFKAGHRRAQPF